MGRQPDGGNHWGNRDFGAVIEPHGEGGKFVSTAERLALFQGEAMIQRLQVWRCRAWSEGLEA